MPKISMPSKYLAKEDIHGEMTVTIKDCASELIGQGKEAEEKWILYFEETTKGVVINATNLDTLVELFGSDESEDWEGETIVLYVDPDVRYAGKKVGGIRFKGVQEKKAVKTQDKAVVSNGTPPHWPVQDDCYGMLLEEVPSDHLDTFLEKFPNAALNVRRMAKTELERRG